MVHTWFILVAVMKDEVEISNQHPRSLDCRVDLNDFVEEALLALIIRQPIDRRQSPGDVVLSLDKGGELPGVNPLSQDPT